MGNFFTNVQILAGKNHGQSRQQVVTALRQWILKDGFVEASPSEDNRYVPSLVLALTFARVFKCSTEEIFTLEIQP